MTSELSEKYLTSKSLLATVLHMGIIQIVGLSVQWQRKEGKGRFSSWAVNFSFYSFAYTVISNFNENGVFRFLLQVVKS